MNKNYNNYCNVFSYFLSQRLTQLSWTLRCLLYRERDQILGFFDSLSWGFKHLYLIIYYMYILLSKLADITGKENSYYWLVLLVSEV